MKFCDVCYNTDAEDKDDKLVLQKLFSCWLGFTNHAWSRFITHKNWKLYQKKKKNQSVLKKGFYAGDM